MAITIKNSPRLSYRFMDQNDTEKLFELDQDEDVMRYINGGKKTTREDIEQRFLPRFSAYRNPNTGWGLWQVNTLNDDLFIGWVLVRPMGFFDGEDMSDEKSGRNDRDLEIGWRFKKLSWGKGYATEAAKQVANAISSQSDIDSFCAIADSDNFASISIMKKMGMRYIKTENHPISPVGVDLYRANIGELVTE